jgi:hypothetical protein
MRTLCLALLAALMLAPAAGRPAEPAKEQAVSTVIVQMRPLDSVIEDYRYVARLIDKDHPIVKMAEQFIQSELKDYTKGIDTTKPFGLYGSITGDKVESSDFIFVVPITNAKNLQATFDKLEIKVKDEGGGISSFKGKEPLASANETVYYRIANGHAYLTTGDRAQLAPAKLRKPADLWDPANHSLMSMRWRFGDMSEKARNEMVEELKKSAKKELETKKPGESEEDYRGRVEFAKVFEEWAERVLREGQDFSYDFDIDRKANDTSIALALSAKPKTVLAERFAEWGRRKHPAGALVTEDSAASLVFNFLLSDETRRAYTASIRKDIEKKQKEEKDPAQRALLEGVWKTVEPAFNDMEILQWAGSLRGPTKGGKYTAVLGIGLRDGRAVNKLIREMAKSPPDPKVKIVLDVDRVGEVAIHRLETQGAEELERKLFGGGKTYIAATAKAAFLTKGDGSLEAIKAAIAAKPREVPLLQAAVGLHRLTPLFAAEYPDAAKAFEKVFAEGKGNDTIRLSLEGGASLRFRVGISLDAVAALVKGVKSLGENLDKPASDSPALRKKKP